MKRSVHQSESGYLIILTLIITVTMSAIGVSIMSVVASKYSSSSRGAISENAISAAEAGLTDSVQQLKSNTAFTGWPDLPTSGRRVFYDRGTLGKATYSSVVTPISTDNTQTVTSTGYIYRSAADITNGVAPVDTKKVKMIIKRSQTPYLGSAYIGAGSLYLAHGTVLLSNDIHVRGKIIINGGGIGSAAKSVDVNVANYACQSGSVWPVACGPASPPIVNQYIFPGKWIYGTVCATDQTDGSAIAPGPTGQGLISPPCKALPADPPVFDKKSFAAKMDPVKIAGNSFNCPLMGGTITLPANKWITGDLAVGKPTFGSCTINVTGDLYIEGNIVHEISERFKVADSTGLTKPVIVFNGKYTQNYFNNGFVANASNTPAYLISFYSTNSTCSANANVPSSTSSTCLTDLEAMASAAVPPGGSNSNYGAFNCPPGTGSDFSGVLFYAYYGVVNCYVGSGSFRAVAGQGMDLRYFSSFNILSAGPSPFGDILSQPTYVSLDYQQVY